MSDFVLLDMSVCPIAVDEEVPEEDDYCRQHLSWNVGFDRSGKERDRRNQSIEEGNAQSENDIVDH